MTDIANLIDRLDGIAREGGIGLRKREIIVEAVEALRRDGVWVVVAGDDPSDIQAIEGVFSTKERAEKWIGRREWAYSSVRSERHAVDVVADDLDSAGSTSET